MTTDPDRRCIAVWVTLNDDSTEDMYIQVERMHPLPWPLVARVLLDASEAIERKLEEIQDPHEQDE